jgi:hypothetical protein
MLKSVVVALVSLGLVILTTLALAPADAATSNSETYIWSFASLDSNQLVCKQVVSIQNEHYSAALPKSKWYR